MKKQKWLGNLCLAVVTLSVALVAAEFVLRQLYDKPKRAEGPKTNWAVVPERVWTEYHPTLGWFHQKSKKAVLTKDALNVEINTNSGGMRGLKNYSVQKPAHTTRILAAGDSFFFGWGVKDDETFAARLEQSDSHLEVLNFGVPGYGLDQILLTYREMGRAYKPDLVIVGIFPEDFWRNTRSFADTGYAKPYFVLSGKNLLLKNVPTPQPFELKYNQFPNVIESNFFENFLEQSLIYRLARRGVLRIGKNLEWVDPDTTDEWVLGQEILKTFIAEIRADEADVILVLVPPDRWLRSIEPDPLEKSLSRFAQREHVPLIDLTPIFLERSRQSDISEYYIKNDGHWTAKGHELVASVLKDFLKEKKIIS